MNFSNMDADAEVGMNSSILGNRFGNMTVAMESDVRDVRMLATSYLIYKIGRSYVSIIV